jgi:hypothetical protein
LPHIIKQELSLAKDAGTRVSLDSVVHAFRRGESPEGIAESFPVLTLEQILGSLAFIWQIAPRSGLYARLTEARRKATHPRA